MDTHILTQAKTFRCLGRLLGIVLTFFLWLPTIYSQNEVGNIRGKLMDRQLGKPIVNHPVTLSIHKTEDITTRETTTDENGSYRFENLPIDVETHYSVSTIYEGTEHVEKDIMLTSFVPDLSVDIMLGVTDDVLQIRVKSHNIVIGFPPEDHPQDGAVSIIEAYNVENSGDLPFQTTYNDEKAGLYLALPAGYSMFEPRAPATLKVNAAADHVILTDMLHPTPATELLQLGYTYIFHAEGHKLNLSRPVRFHTDQISIWIPEGINLVPKSKLFKPVQREPVHNMIYTIYQATPADGFPIDSDVDLSLTVPRLPQAKSNIGQMVFIAIASALAGGLLVVAIYRLRVERRAAAESDPSEVITHDAGWLRKLNDVDIAHARTARLEFITQLDAMYEKQEISERVYNRLRKEQTERLTEILDQHKERGLDA